ASVNVVPTIGSPPMPMQVDCPIPRLVSCPTASYVKVPERETMPTCPPLWMCPGMMPILHLPGVITPGQFGPISRVEGFVFKNDHTCTMSFTGMPSVIQTTKGMPQSAASMIASAANGGGTKITEALAAASLTACSTVLNTGRSKCV